MSNKKIKCRIIKINVHQNVHVPNDHYFFNLDKKQIFITKQIKKRRKKTKNIEPNNSVFFFVAIP